MPWERWRRLGTWLDASRCCREARLKLAADDETVGPQRAASAARKARSPGDPAKAATAILQALDSSTPPLRLALGAGADAVEAIGSTLDARRAELDAWSSLSHSTTP